MNRDRGTQDGWAVRFSDWLGRFIDEWANPWCEWLRLKVHIAFLCVRLQLLHLRTLQLQFGLKCRDFGFKPSDFLLIWRRRERHRVFNFLCVFLTWCFHKSKASSSGLTTQAQRPGDGDAENATGAVAPGSLKRVVRD